MRRATLGAAIAILLAAGAFAQVPPRSVAPVADSMRAFPPAPVVLDGDTLFWVYSRIGPLTPDDRAAGITQRLERIARDAAYRNAAIAAAPGESGTDILAGDIILMTLTAEDARWLGLSPEAAADTLGARIHAAIARHQRSHGLRAILTAVGLTLLATAVLIAVIRLILWLTRSARGRLDAWLTRARPSLRVQRWEIMSGTQVGSLMAGLLRFLQATLLLLLGYGYLSLVLGFFPWTQGLAAKLLGYLVAPIATGARGLVNFIPSLFVILVIVGATRIVLWFVRGLFLSIGEGRLEVGGFYPDWAMPTYKLVRILIIAFAVVLMFPYIPGSSSPAFRGISIFIGALISFGSTSSVANMVAGLLLTYMRPFKVGDRVSIAGTQGDVLEKTILVTRVQTIKNEQITIPNSLVLGSHIVNYSAAAQTGGLILHSAVTIGYDVPWRQVHAMLIESALATEQVLEAPAPFVLQTSLDDFYVSYELNAYTDQPQKMAAIYSALHASIQDTFAKNGVEIMSPHYRAERDGNAPALPAAGARDR